ncbi:MAG: LacI family DNA-binding transcriptional regulator [Vicinamibacteria bacterium]
MKTGRRPTIDDVARQAGVSKSLVSLVVRGDRHVSPERRASVLRAVGELGYRPNAMAQGLVQKKTRIVGVLVSDLNNPFFADVIAGIQARARAIGYRVLMSTGDRQPQHEDEAIETMLQLRVDGLILGSPMTESAQMVRASKELAVVVIGRPARAASVDSVADDGAAGALAVVKHCVSLGHRRIAHIDGGEGAGATERRVGYEAAMRKLRLQSEIVVGRGAYTEAGGHQGARELLDRRPRPTAIFAANDLAAIGALNAIEEAGLRVPQDISLVGYDNTSLAAMRHLSLTTVHQPRHDIGQMAMDLLIERIRGVRVKPRRVVLAPTLVVRTTTAPPPRDRIVPSVRRGRPNRRMSTVKAK